MPASRTAGQRGRLPARPVGARFNIGFVHEYTRSSPLPPPSYPVDVSGGITEWGMLGNDKYGDCTFAGREHAKMAKAAAGQIHETWETAAALVKEYLAYNHGQDVGAVIADLLLAWYRAGIILAFAPVDHTSPVQVDAAVQAFHGVYAGVSLTDDADQLFEEGKPWGTGSTTPDPSEGHCIIKVKADGAKLDEWVTWGGLEESTQEWTRNCLDEAWVIITQEDADAADLDIAALRADIDALGGTGGAPAPAPVPVPAPTPQPAPSPTPGPADPSTVLAPIAAAWAVLPHTGKNKVMAEALLAWLHDEGYVTGEAATATVADELEALAEMLRATAGHDFTQLLKFFTSI